MTTLLAITRVDWKLKNLDFDTWNFTNQREMHNFVETPICMGPERIKNPFHPTQKPVRVLRTYNQGCLKRGGCSF
jgi:site-specific DNA-methyltransferase (adenine-specific)/modification methylase